VIKKQKSKWLNQCLFVLIQLFRKLKTSVCMFVFRERFVVI